MLARAVRGSKLIRLDMAVRSLASNVSVVQVAVVTQNYLTSEEFRAVFDGIPKQIKTLLIADEVHNLGSTKFISNPPERFDYLTRVICNSRATVRPGRDACAVGFFRGRKSFEFSLAEAIGVCLVPYNVLLTPSKFD